MVRLLLWRGMLAGLAAAFVAGLFALVVAEPLIDVAIALEAHHAMPGMAEPEIVSRATQKGLGLFTALSFYGVAVGGLLAILFAVLHGRIAGAGPRLLALALGIAAFAVLTLVPAIKYPPTPPAVGLHDTVRLRTAAYAAMLVASLVAAGGAAWVHNVVRGSLGAIDRWLLAVFAYVALATALAVMLPHVDEVPADFPASLLWRFRLASIGMQALFWIVAADLFGRMAERIVAPATSCA